MVEKTAGDSKGLIRSLATLASTFIAILHTRLDLLCLDLEDERDYIFSLLVQTLIALFSLAVGTVLAVITLAVIFWDTHRLLALGMLTGFFLATGIGLSVFIVYRMKSRPRLLAASLAELSRDRDSLGTYE